MVADVTSKLFGNRIAESNVITETLERITDATATAESVRTSLGEAIDGGVSPRICDTALREHPARGLGGNAPRHFVLGGRPALGSGQADDGDGGGG